MKKILLIAAGLSLGVATTSCSLEKFPETMYAENNTSGTGDSETAINTRELLEGQLTAMYNYMKGDLQTYWYQLITLAEARADNAYGGNMAETRGDEGRQRRVEPHRQRQRIRLEPVELLDERRGLCQPGHLQH